MDFSIRIGGEAGQGIQSISSILARTFIRQGLYIFINQDFESRIRGGHNFDQVRISNMPVRAAAGKVQILIALDKETTSRDMGCLANGGFMLFDGDGIEYTSDDPNHLSIPFGKIGADDHVNRCDFILGLFNNNVVPLSPGGHKLHNGGGR